MVWIYVCDGVFCRSVGVIMVCAVYGVGVCCALFMCCLWCCLCVAYAALCVLRLRFVIVFGVDILRLVLRCWRRCRTENEMVFF